jgi:hypothetical protein
LGILKTKRAKHFGVGKPEIVKGGESRETRNFGISEIDFRESRGQEAGSIFASRNPKRDYGHMGSGHMD